MANNTAFGAAFCSFVRLVNHISLDLQGSMDQVDTSIAAEAAAMLAAPVKINGSEIDSCKFTFDGSIVTLTVTEGTGKKVTAREFIDELEQLAGNFTDMEYETAALWLVVEPIYSTWVDKVYTKSTGNQLDFEFKYGEF